MIYSWTRIFNQETFLTKNKSFTLIGTLENFYPQKVYLNKIIENSIFAIDSSAVIENKFNFNGFVEYPERFALSFKEKGFNYLEKAYESHYLGLAEILNYPELDAIRSDPRFIELLNKMGIEE